MPTKLEGTLKREITMDGETYVLTLTPTGVKMTQKGHRKGREITWRSLWTGDDELAQQLRVSVQATSRDA